MNRVKKNRLRSAAHCLRRTVSGALFAGVQPKAGHF